MTDSTASRVADIARQIRGAVAPFIGAQAGRVEAQEAFNASGDVLNGTRHAIMVNLAGMSLRAAWTKGEIGQAATMAAAMSNNKEDKSLATFIGETKRAMSPKVRAHVAFLDTLTREAWDVEGALDKSEPKPCRKAFKRAYHMFQQALALCEDGTLLHDHGAVYTWAVERDPDLDYDKVAKRLDGIRRQLQSFAQDFPLEDFAVIDEALSSVTKKALKDARATAVQAEAEKLEALPLAPIPDVVAERVFEENQDVDLGDPIEDALSELALAA